MAYSNPQPVELAFPLKGVDRSLPARRQPPMTTYELLNVRAFPPSSDRLGGGTREGHSKLFDEDNQAGTSAARRIQGLSVLTEATNITDPSALTRVALSEDWSSQTAGNPTDLGTNWYPFQITSSGARNINASFSINGSQQLALDSGVSSSLRSVLCGFFVDQAVGISMVIKADGQADTNFGNNGGDDQIMNVGPTLGVSNDGTTGILACVSRVGADQVQCKIYEYNLVTFTEKATSATLTLNGSATIIDWTISMTVSAGVVTATFESTGALTGPADLDEELTYETALTGKRGGIGLFCAPTTSVNVDSKVIDSVTLTKLVPPDNTVFADGDPSIANPFDANQYYLPSPFTGIARSAAGTITTTAGGTTSGSAIEPPAIDDTANEWTVQNPGTSNADHGQEVNFAVYTDTTQRLGITLKPKPGGIGFSNDMASPVFRASADGTNALILFLVADNSGSADQGRTIITRVYGVSIVDNVATDLGSIWGTNLILEFRDEDGFRATDDGNNINFYVNGILVYSFSPSVFGNWTTAIADGLAEHAGVGFTGGARVLSTALLPGEFGQIQIVQGDTPAEITFDNVKNKLAIFSAETLQVGDTKELTVTDITGPNLSNPLPMAASFNRKFYAIDGIEEIIIDPATNTSSDWASAVTDGTLPSGCGLVTNFRGSTYLASTNADPTIWYKSRTLDPLDWDYGADPLVSSAVAGNNGEVGQPADAITALIPYSSDYMVFGMSRSLGVLEGDPGYGGQFQIVSNETGIAGPRAFCFDDRGNLYFMGSGGLYRMMRAQFDPEPVGPRKLRRVLEEIDTSTNLIQMGFRPTDRTVRIFITPADGETVGTHVVYDTRTDGFFLDKYPLDFGPWAVAQTMGVTETDRNLILAGNDGYIRRPDDAALSDDGTAISSLVEIVIPEIEMGRAESICQEIQFVTGEGGAAVQWYWFVGDSPEEVRLMTVEDEQYSATGTIQGTGFLDPVGLRETGAAHKIRFGATSSVKRWSLERAIAEMAITTLRRR